MDLIKSNKKKFIATKYQYYEGKLMKEIEG